MGVTTPRAAPLIYILLGTRKKRFFILKIFTKNSNFSQYSISAVFTILEKPVGSKNQKALLNIAYCPQKRKLDEFLDYLVLNINKAATESKPLILMGD